MPNAKRRWLPAFFLLMLPCSCSSVIERVNRHSYIYPGVQLDYMVLFHDMDGMNGWEIYPFRVLWSVVDLPFSIALDTICLPYDVLSYYSYHPVRAHVD